MSLDRHLEDLKRLLSEMESVLVCYSGGIDSALVLAAAHDVLGSRAIGMTAVSASLAPFEKEAAVSIAKQIGARHELVESHEVDDPSYVANAPDRCFHCKSELYRISSIKRAEWGLAHVVNGTNLDDLGDYRPGLEAAKNAGVRSPLIECGFHKDDVRRVAQALALSVWDKPASACLSSRIPYGTSVTRERLAQIGGLEAELHALGLRQVRVRWHALNSADGSRPIGERNSADGSRPIGERNSADGSRPIGERDTAFARIEVATNEMAKAFEARDAIVAGAKRYGFKYVTLDLQGYRTGSHNEVLVGRSLRVVS